MKRIFRALAGKGSPVILLCLLTASAAAQISPGPAPVVNALTSSTPKATAPANAPDDGRIQLGTGDLVEVSVYGVPDYDTKTRVNGDGNINLPLINDVHVEGLTVDEAEKVIGRRLDQGGFIRDPHVQLFVQENNSDGISVLGEVAHPGIFPAFGDQDLFNVISAAGGLSDRAGSTITITHRDQADKPITVAISHNLEDHPKSNVPIYPGDTIMVRRADVVYVVGDVGRPSGFLMDGGRLSVLEAVALAGGTNSTAKLNGTRIIRKGPGGLTELQVPLKKILQAKSKDIPLEANDILFVPASARKIISGRTAQAALQMATAVSIYAVHP